MKVASSEILQGRGMTEEKRETVIDRKLLELLVCPLTKGPLVYDQKRSELISKLSTFGLSGERRYSDHAAIGSAPIED